MRSGAADEGAENPSSVQTPVRGRDLPARSARDEAARVALTGKGFGKLVTLQRRSITSQQAAQQGAAPDRLQLRSLFLLASLPTGELGRWAAVG